MNYKTQWESNIKAALSLDMIYAERESQNLLKEIKKPLIPAAVLILIGFSETGEASVLFIRRTDTVETHKGQMAFPGGHCEEADQDQSSITALRETEEEVGIPPHLISIFGTLPSLVTVTGYWITPVVGLLNCPIEEVSFRLDTEEIAEALWISHSVLTSEGVYRQETVTVGSHTHPIQVYQVDSYRIWGATGSMLKNLLDRLSALS